MKQGDYVLATKYTDGNSQDPWCVGFFRGMTDHTVPRYDIVDNQDVLFRGNGFRKAKKITQEEGQYILDNKEMIEQSDKSLWWCLKQKG